MKSTPDSVAVSSVRVWASDRSTLDTMMRTLERFGISDAIGVRAGKSARRSALFGDGEIGRICLLIGADGLLSEALLSGVKEVADAGGWVGIWAASGGAQGNADVDSDGWLTAQLALQQGATVSTSLDALAAAVGIAHLARERTERAVCIQGRPNGIVRRLKAELAVRNIPIGSAKGALSLSVDPSGRIVATENDAHPLGEPRTAATAVQLAFDGAQPGENEDADVDAAFAADQADVALIAQPPPRLLSEIASKKLFAAFGMALPDEQLCQSPSEAARVVSARPGPSVLKLVKPRLESKDKKGAVVRNVQGAAAARRAVQQLESRGMSMAPPKPLGILVSEQVDGGLRLWVEMRIHPQLGRMIRIGEGDSPDSPPLLALRAPASAREVKRAFGRVDVAISADTMRKVSRSIARFSAAAARLSGRICRAEIHPLVVTDTHEEALVLDALAEVGPDEAAKKSP